MRYLAKKIYPLMMIIFLSGLIFSSCRKNGSKPNPPNNNKGTTHSDEDSLKWYIYQYMQVTITTDTTFKIPSYLWYNQVPFLNPFNSLYANADSLLSTIISYPKNPSDRYSFLDRTGQVTGEIQQGVQGDFGLDIRWAADQSNTTSLWVASTYKNSSAGSQGVQRGWQIISVSGNTDVSYDGPGYGSGNYSNVDRIVNALLYNTGSTTVGFKKPDGSTVTLTLVAGNYMLTPVMFDSIYNVNGTKVGYFVFNSFVSVYDTAGNPSETKNELDKTFAQFKAAGINDLIVDLRYNGGGSVGTAEYIDSLIAPASAAGKPMYTYSYNDKMTQYEGPSQLDLPTTINFPSSTGSLNLANVFFITSRSTVSASELTMNNLKPYMNVKLVGDTTYGKPAGFFTFPIFLWDSVKQQEDRHIADLYAINFHTVNAQGSGNYYTGIAPDDVILSDNFTVDWGNIADKRLAAALKYAQTGSFRLNNARVEVPAYTAIPTSPFRHSFKGMVDYRLSRKMEQKIQPFLRKAH